jgi:CubicO group peptidase (beta-lactamase class C family)
MLTRPLLSLLLLVSAVCAHADAALQGFVEQTLNGARIKGHPPAVAALIQINGKIEAQAALGVREFGNPTPATLDDRWHLGSDTKAMTATMIARLAERGVLGFDETLAQIFPGVAPRMDPALRDVTIKQLLSHTSGLGGGGKMSDFLPVIEREKGVRAQRAAMVAYFLTLKPFTKAGEFAYSNLGFTIAGAAAEARTGETWEELIQSEVWKPLGIKRGGFGAPGKARKIDQPRGHVLKDGELTALEPGDPRSDNPAAIGPAGTANMPLGDWLLFAQDQLDGFHGHGKLLKPETYKMLQTPVSKNYALGWGVMRDKNGALSILSHMGSNGYWVSDVRIYPRHDVIVLIVMNAGDEDTVATARAIGKALQDKLKPFD